MSNPKAPAALPGSGTISLIENPYQQTFLRVLGERFMDGETEKRAYTRLGLFAGRRAGKTRIGAVGVVLEAQRKPYQSWMVCSGSYPKLHDFVMPAIAEALPKSWLAKPFSAQHYEWTLKNGTLIRARSLDDINRGRGSGLDGLWIDEARDVAHVAWKTLVPALMDRRGVAVITTTPSGFDWCYDAFWKPAAEGIPGYWACKYRSVENPALDVAEVEAARRDMDPLFFQQEMEAEFVSFTGAIYGESLTGQLLDSDTDIKKLIPEWPRINPDRSVLVGLDPGADHPFAGVVLVSTPKGLVVIDEYLQREGSAFRHAQNFFALLRSHQISGASIWAIDRSQKQMAIELAQHGIYVSAAENDVVAGIQRVKSWLMGQRLFIARQRCPRLVQQMFSYRWAENTDGRGEARRERVIKTNDDLPDALRYAMMSWPELPYPEAASPLRSLEGLPDEYRWARERDQRISHPEQFPDDDESGLAADPQSNEPDDDNPLASFWT